NIICDNYNDVEVVRLHDASGRMVAQYNMNQRSLVIDLDDFSTGFFYLNFISVNGDHITRKITKN
ncbi:MAG: T9SS type A sorting domain-containing protein, partial [Flavobacteriales bacterium]|nr:T9SS type A sorting domain-containing protein [Flavobacteriales bacterium]